MKIDMTPLHLETLLHYYTSPIMHPNESEAALEFTMYLVRKGLLRKDESSKYYQCTDLGRAHVAQILSLPLPRQAWLSATGKVIETV